MPASDSSLRPSACRAKDATRATRIVLPDQGIAQGALSTRSGGTSAVGTRRGTVSARANLVIQTQCQRDALARQVDLHDLDVGRRAVVEQGHRSCDLLFADGEFLGDPSVNGSCHTDTYWGPGLTR
jgi:hypothetical protein